MYGRYWSWLEGNMRLCWLYLVRWSNSKPNHSVGSSLCISMGRKMHRLRVMAVGERTPDPGPWARPTHSVTSYDSHDSRFPFFQHHRGSPRRGRASFPSTPQWLPHIRCRGPHELQLEPGAAEWTRNTSPSITVNNQGQ